MAYIKAKEKELLKQYRDFTNKELLYMLRNLITNVGVIMLSEKEAEKIFLKYNKKCSLDKFNQNIKKRYFELKECVRLRKIAIPSEWYDVSITDDDVIKRIKEMETYELGLVETRCRVIDCYYFDEDLKDVVESLSLETQLEKTKKFYEKIINIEFNNRKQLKKQS